MRASHRQHGSRRRGDPPQSEPRQLEREHDRLLRENENLRQQLIERDRKLAEAEKQIAEAEKQIAEGEKQIADLERQLKLRRQNSTTSSKPPSSDGLAGEQRPRGSRKRKSRRKPGGQPGHRGCWRGLAPVERVNEVIEVFPPRCCHCHHRFPDCGPKPVTEGTPRRHQVTELPPFEAHITEYQCQRALCPECGKATSAALPNEIDGHFGPQLTALIAYLTVVCRMPRRVVLELIGQVMGIQLTKPGQHSKQLGRSQRGDGRTMCGTGKRTAEPTCDQQR